MPLLVDEPGVQETALSVLEPEELPAPVDEAGMGIDAPAFDEDVDVLMRGPLHEAFASAHQGDPQPSPLVVKQPPANIDELPPEYKPEGNNVQWIPGYWAWDEAQDDFIWVSGVWRDVPPQRRWIPGYWEDSTDEAIAGFRWVPGFWAESDAQEVGYLPQPPKDLDQGPSVQAPGENYFYVPGNWDYQQGNYRWLSGHWQPVVTNWIWIPARYVWTPRGCIFLSGFWDYVVDARGTCFAPVYFRRPVYLAHQYHYRPSCVVNVNVDFLTHVFVRPGHAHYYYGDWYGANYVNIGFRPWVNVSSHYHNYDPLWTYYRCQPSPYGGHHNVVQYLGQQHKFYFAHQDYRPRTTLSAHINFVNKSGHGQHRDYVRKSTYVNTYEQVVRQSASGEANRNRNHQNRDQIVDAERNQRRFQRVETSELASNQKKIDSMARLQKQRQQAEIRERIATSGNSQLDEQLSRRTLNLPAEERTTTNNKQARNRQGVRGTDNVDAQDQSGNPDLQRAVNRARNEAEIAQRKLNRENRQIVDQKPADTTEQSQLNRQLRQQDLARQRTERQNKNPAAQNREPVIRQNPISPEIESAARENLRLQQKLLEQRKQLSRQPNVPGQQNPQQQLELLKQQQLQKKQPLDQVQNQNRTQNRIRIQDRKQPGSENLVDQQQQKMAAQRQLDNARQQQEQLKLQQQRALEAQQRQREQAAKLQQQKQQAAQQNAERQRQRDAQAAQNQANREAAQNAAADRQRQQQAKQQQQAEQRRQQQERQKQNQDKKSGKKNLP